ncbi:MAG: folate-binding protein [Alphaproteobacteria bacterium]|nr:folate-binding protein [Alphaproteobacteria bacterium]
MLAIKQAAVYDRADAASSLPRANLTIMKAVYLAHRSVAGLAGPDACGFLQGLVSNDVTLAMPGKAVYAALLTPQGKFLYDMFITGTGERYLLDIEAGRAHELIALLSRYKLRSKIQINSLEATHKVFAYPLGGAKSIPDPRHPDLWARAIVENDTQNNDAGNLIEYDRARLQLGVGDGARDIDAGSDVLLEANFDLLNGISFEKGCYMGQELTARTHYRGLVKKRLFPVQMEGNAPPRGAPITLDGKDIGDMRSSVPGIGLAMLRIRETLEMIESNGAFICDGVPLKPFKPAWMQLPG